MCIKTSSGIQRWPEVKEKKVKMSSKKHPLGLAKKEEKKKRSLGWLGTESEVGQGTGNGLGEKLGRNGDHILSLALRGEDKGV